MQRKLRLCMQGGDWGHVVGSLNEGSIFFAWKNLVLLGSTFYAVVTVGCRAGKMSSIFWTTSLIEKRRQNIIFRSYNPSQTGFVWQIWHFRVSVFTVLMKLVTLRQSSQRCKFRYQREFPDKIMRLDWQRWKILGEVSHPKNANDDDNQIVLMMILNIYWWSHECCGLYHTSSLSHHPFLRHQGDAGPISLQERWLERDVVLAPISDVTDVERWPWNHP